MNRYNDNYDYIDHFPKIARLEYEFLNIISRRTGSYINAGVFNPDEKRRHFKTNCHAKFRCNKCGNQWTSNLVTAELWWKNGKKQFDVRIYGQQCKKCNGAFIRPKKISAVENIIEIFVKILTTYDNRCGKRNMNKYRKRNKNRRKIIW